MHKDEKKCNKKIKNVEVKKETDKSIVQRFKHFSQKQRKYIYLLKGICI